MTQSIEKSFLIDLLTLNNAIYRNLLTLLKDVRLFIWYKFAIEKSHWPWCLSYPALISGPIKTFNQLNLLLVTMIMCTLLSMVYGLFKPCWFTHVTCACFKETALLLNVLLSYFVDLTCGQLTNTCSKLFRNPKRIIIASSRYLVCYIIAIPQIFNLFRFVKTKTYLNH